MRFPLSSIALALLIAGTSSIARADEPEEPAPATTADPYAAFPLVTPHDKHYLKAGAEITGVLAVGLVDYLLNTTARGGLLRTGETRWGLRYDWPTFRDKLTGTGINFDANRFGTNYVAHPFAGTMYYSAARTNHLGFGESFLFAIIGSTTWEFFGEIREVTSVNDLIVTPVSGVAIGEALIQMSAFFSRGEKRFSNDALSFLFSPIKAFNEATDDAHTLRSANTDGLGFTRDVWHRFVASAGAGVTVQDREGPEHPGGTYTDLKVGLDLSLANLPGYGGAGREAHLFDDGNMSNVRFDLTFSRGQLVDSLFATRIVPVGYYFRDAKVDDDGRPRGQGALVGLRMGFEYGSHDWDRDGSRALDVISTVSPVGVAAEHIWAGGPLQVRTALDVVGAIAGVTPYALTDYRRIRQDGLRGTPTPVRNRGYYHGLLVSVVPSVEVAWRSLRLGGRMRLDAFRGLEGLDENQANIDESIKLSDRRAITEATFAITPRGTPIRFAIDGRRQSRTGEMGPVQASRTETSMMGSLGVVF